LHGQVNLFEKWARSWLGSLETAQPRLKNLIANIYTASKLHGRYLGCTIQTFHAVLIQTNILLYVIEASNFIFNQKYCNIIEIFDCCKYILS
jgi:hypothetical protein